MRKFIFSVLISIYSFGIYSQELRKNFKSYDKSIYLELLGSTYYSINFDRTYLISDRKFARRLGFSYLLFPGSWQHFISIPLEFTYLRGDNHNLELGLGLTPTWELVFGRSSFYHGLYLDLTSRIGYRYQKEDGGFLFRFGLIPSKLIYAKKIKSDLRTSIGMSLGYTFKNKKD